MPAWATVTITLGASVIAVAGTLLGTHLLNRHARAERVAAAAAARRERAASILGRVRTLLTDMDPVRVGVNANAETTPALLDELGKRVNALREELSIFAAADEDDRVTAAAAKLESAIYSTHNRVAWHVRDLLHPGIGTNALLMLEQAQAEHLRATTLVRLILDLVRGRDASELEAQLGLLEERGNAGATQPPETGRNEPAPSPGELES